MVWKSTRDVSCAKIEYETRDHYKTLLVCNFYPAGNVNGEFPYNVLPLRRGGGERPDYPDERPVRPKPPPSSNNDYERPSNNRPTNRPTNNRPGGGGIRPRPPYDEDKPDYDVPNRPGNNNDRYPTHPVSVTGSTEILVPLPSSVALDNQKQGALEEISTGQMSSAAAAAAEVQAPVTVADSVSLNSQYPSNLDRQQPSKAIDNNNNLLNTSHTSSSSKGLLSN